MFAKRMLGCVRALVLKAPEIGVCTAILLATSILAFPTQAAPWKTVIVLGDSNADIGNRLESGDWGTAGPPYYMGRWSNGPVGAEVLPRLLGISSANVQNYAIGGAASGQPLGMDAFRIRVGDLPSRDLPEQVTRFLSRGTSSASPADTLVFITIGGNDFGLRAVSVQDLNENGDGLEDCSATEGCWSSHSLVTIGEQIERLIAAGYRNFAFESQSAFGVTPGYTFGTDAWRGTCQNPELTPDRQMFPVESEDCVDFLNDVSDLVNVQSLAAIDLLLQRNQDKDLTIAWLDTNSFMKEIVSSPQTYGFDNVTGQYNNALCTDGSVADPSEDVDRYLWYDCVHRSTVAHSLWAQYAASALNAPGQAAVSGDMLLDVGRTSLAAMRRRLVQGPKDLGGIHIAYVHGAYEHSDTVAGQHFDNDLHGVTVGLDVKLTPDIATGLSLDFIKSEADADDNSSLKSTAYMLGTHLTGDIERWQASWFGAISYGWINYDDINRATNYVGRIAGAETDATSFQFIAGVSRPFTVGAFELTPDAGLLYQDGEIDGYTESGAQSLNRIVNQQDVDSLKAHAGLSAAWTYQADPWTFKPALRLAYEREFRNESRDIQVRQLTSSADMFTYPYPLYGYLTGKPDKNTGLIEGNITAGFRNGIKLQLAFARSFGNDQVKLKRDISLRLTVPLDFLKTPVW